MKTSNTAGIPSNHGDDDDDDQKEFNGMDVEDWLVKQHELADRNQAREGSPRDAVIKSAGEVVRKQRTPREVVDSVGSLLVDDFQTKTVSPVSSRFAQHDLDLGNLNKPPPIPFSETSSDNMAISGLYEDQMTEKEVPPEEVIDASIRRIDGTDDYYIAELTVNSKRDGHMVVDGVRTTNPKIKKILQVSFALAVAIVIAVVAGKITTRFLQEPAPPEAIEIPSSSANDTCLGGTWAQNFSTTVGIRSNLNWTIAEAAIASDKAGFCPIALYMSPLLREILFDKFNRSDDNFTVFPISMYGVQLFDGLDVSILSKMITDPWVGHAMDSVESMFVEGEVVAIDDMYEGMVLTSMSGYPIKIQCNPLRANNISILISTLHSNQFFSNAVMHTVEQYADPPMPWLGKSIFDVLLETNEKRHGDLSDMIDLIQASPDEIKNLLDLRVGDTSAINLFAPTNAAMATMNLTAALIRDDTTLSTFLESHLVSDNFARRFWRYMPISAEATDSSLKMTTRAGRVLDVKINDATVTINGNVRIVQGDIFCEQGILHIIDNPLTLPWDVFGGRS